MENRTNNPRIKPRALAVPCNSCAKPTPFDPTKRTTLCSECHHEASATMEHDTSQMLFTPSLQSGYYSKPSPVTPSSSLKRRADSPAEAESSRKRPFTTAYGSSNSPLVGRAVVGPAAQDFQRSAALEEDEDDDEFEDAPEEQPPEHEDENAVGAANDQYEDENATSAIEQMQQDDDRGVNRSVVEQDDDEAFETDSGEGSYEEPDLFDATFDTKSCEDSADEAQDEYDKDEVMQEDEEREQEDMESEQGSEEDEGEQGEEKGEEETKQLSSTNAEETSAEGVTTNPDNSATAATPTEPRLPDPENDLSLNLKRLRNFHTKARDLIPRLPLSDHRYWIGVLNLDVNAKTFSQEKHFTWMKGNRLTTVRTVWHTYQATTATDNFVLLLGLERVGLTDKMEELDYFNEKKIILRAVGEGLPGSEGRSLIEGIIPPVTRTEVIELD